MVTWNSQGPIGPQINLSLLYSYNRICWCLNMLWRMLLVFSVALKLQSCCACLLRKIASICQISLFQQLRTSSTSLGSFVMKMNDKNFKTHWTLILCIGTLADIRKHQSVFIIPLSRIILLFLSCKIILSSERFAISHNYLSFHTTMFIKCR